MGLILCIRIKRLSFAHSVYLKLRCLEGRAEQISCSSTTCLQSFSNRCNLGSSSSSSTDADVEMEQTLPLKKRLRPSLPPLTVDIAHRGVEDESQSPKTAPVVDEAVMNLRSAIEAKAHRPVIRTYSLSQTRPPQRRSEAQFKHAKLSRQKTLSGESSNSATGSGFGSTIFMRTFSKNYDVTSTASSYSVEEWKRLFDRYDMEHNGQIDGRIPVHDFERIMEENILWTEKVPPQIRANIIASADLNGDGMITQDEFVEMAKGRHIPGFNSRRRRAFRELLRQTVEFIVPYKYQYQNQFVILCSRI